MVSFLDSVDFTFLFELSFKIFLQSCLGYANYGVSLPSLQICCEFAEPWASLKYLGELWKLIVKSELKYANFGNDAIHLAKSSIIQINAPLILFHCKIIMPCQHIPE